VHARHPSTRFASFVATCAPGRVVNANPPWGLHQLGKPMRARVSARWALHGSTPQLIGLRVAKLPPRAAVTVRCIGERCPFGRRTAASRRGGRIDLLDVIGAGASKLSAGQTLELLVTAHTYNGKLVRWRLRNARAPRPVQRCVPLGNTKPRRRC
jgi:hypothetical protein